MVYLLHFDQPYTAPQRNAHARRVQVVKHYIGFTDDLDQRMNDHRAGRGANLVRVLKQHGIGFHCVRTWDGDHSVERQLKARHNAAKLCPVCHAKHAPIVVDINTTEAIAYD